MSRSLQEIPNKETLLKTIYKQDNQTCGYCLSPFLNSDIQNASNKDIDKIKDTLNFYEPIQKILQCSGCNIKVHDLCHNDYHRKKSSSNFLCIYCTDKGHEQIECVICNNSYGMKKIFYDNGTENYVHLICAYFDPNFYFSNFKNKKIQKFSINNEFEIQNSECIICLKELNCYNYAQCNSCNVKNKSHLICLLFYQAQVLEDSNYRGYSLNSYTNPVPAINSLLFSKKIDLSPQNQNQITKYLYDKLDINKNPKLEQFPNFFFQQLLNNQIQGQQLIFSMICQNCKIMTIQEPYCCNINKGTAQMVMCDICQDWIHVKICDQNKNTTIFSNDEEGKDYKYNCINQQSGYSQDSCYICKYCEDVAFYYNKINKNKNIKIISKPKSFINYYVMSLKLEQMMLKNDNDSQNIFECLSKNLIDSFFYKSENFQFQLKLKTELKKFKSNNDINFYYNLFLNIFQRSYQDENEALKKLEDQCLQFQDSLKNKDYRNNDNQIQYIQLKEFLRQFTEKNQNFIQKPSHKILIEIKQYLQKHIQDNNNDQIKIFVHFYILYAKQYLFDPFNHFIDKLEQFYKQNSQKFEYFYEEQICDQLKQCFQNQIYQKDIINLKNFINNKISVDKFQNFLQEFSQSIIVQKIIENNLDTDMQYLELLEKNFEKLKINQVEFIIERLTNCFLRPQDDKMFLIENFVNEYSDFAHHQQNVINDKNKLLQLDEKLQNKNFLKKKKNIDLFITREHLQLIQNQKYGQKFIKKYLDKCIVQIEQIQQFEKDFIENCLKNKKRSLKNLCKEFIRDIKQKDKLIISEKSVNFLIKCNEEYEIEKKLNKENMIKKAYLESIDLQNSCMSNFLRNKIKYQIELHGKIQKQIEKEIQENIQQKNDKIADFIEWCYKQCEEKKIYSHKIEQYKYNITLFQDINYLKTGNIDLEFQNFSDEYIQSLIDYLKQLDDLQKIKKQELKYIKYFVSSKFEELYLIFRKKQVKFIFQKENSPRLSMANKEYQSKYLNEQDYHEKQIFDIYFQKVQNFQQNVIKLTSKCILNPLIFKNPSEIFEEINSICQESDNFTIDNDIIQQNLEWLSQLRIKLKIFIITQEFLNLNKLENGFEIYQQNSSKYQDIYSTLVNQQKRKQKNYKQNKVKNKKLYDRDIFDQEQEFYNHIQKFIICYEQMRQIQKEYENFKRQKQNIDNSQPNIFIQRFDQFQVEQIIPKLRMFSFCFQDFYLYIIKQRDKLQQTVKIYIKLLDDILDSNVKELIDLKPRIENAINLVQNLDIKNNLIESNFNIFRCMSDFIKNNGDSYDQFNKFYDEIFRMLEQQNFQNFQQRKFIIDLNNLQKKFEDIWKNLQRIQNYQETHNDFINYLSHINTMVDPEQNSSNYFCCFNYAKYQTLQDEIKVCQQLINNQFEEYFKNYYKENQPGSVGKIKISDKLQQIIQKKLQTLKKLEEYVSQNLKGNKSFTLQDQIGLFKYIQNICDKGILFSQNEYINSIIKKIKPTRKFYDENIQHIKEQLDKILFILEDILQNKNLQQLEIPKLNENFEQQIQFAYQCNEILDEEKIQFILFYWHFKILVHFLKCLYEKEYEKFDQFYDSVEYKNIETLMKKDNIMSSKQIRIFTIMSMNYITSFILCYINDNNEKEYIQKQWVFKHGYQLIYKDGDNWFKYLNNSQQLEKAKVVTSDFYINFFQRNFLFSIKQMMLFFEQKINKMINQVTQDFKEKISGEQKEKRRRNEHQKDLYMKLTKVLFKNKNQEQKHAPQIEKNFFHQYQQYVKHLSLEYYNKFYQKISTFIMNIEFDNEFKKNFINKDFQFKVIKNAIQKQQKNNIKCKKEKNDNSSITSIEDFISLIEGDEIKQKQKKQKFLNESFILQKKFKEKVGIVQDDILESKFKLSQFDEEEEQIVEINFKFVEFIDKKLETLKFKTKYNIEELNFSKTELYIKDEKIEEDDNLLIKISNMFQNKNLLLKNYEQIIFGWLEDYNNNSLIKFVRSFEKQQYKKQPLLLQNQSFFFVITKYVFLNNVLKSKIKYNNDDEIQVENLCVFIILPLVVHQQLQKDQEKEEIIKSEFQDDNQIDRQDLQDLSIDHPDYQIIII